MYDQFGKKAANINIEMDDSIDPTADFMRFFTGMAERGRGFRETKHQVHMPNIVQPIELTFEEMYSGCEKEVEITRMSLCKCKKNKKCKECDGTGMVREEVSIQVIVSPGVHHDFPIEMENIGHAVFPEHISDFGSERGHVIFMVRELPHELYKRYAMVEKREIDFSDIAVEFDLTLSESFIGFNKQILFLDGENLEININEPVREGDIFVLKEKGMPKYKKDDEFGDLFIIINVEHPKEKFGKFTREQKAKIMDVFGEVKVPSKKTNPSFIPLEKYKEEVKAKITAEDYKKHYDRRNNGGNQTAECVHQ
jgi:DnaJ-class molecular chaperone